MIIDINGNMLPMVFLYNGIVIKDGSYSIFVEFEKDEDKAREKEIIDCKKHLSETDYKAIKYSEGALSEEEYAEDKANRKAWRDRINELEALITYPTLTKEQIKEAERKATLKAKGEQDG